MTTKIWLYTLDGTSSPGPTIGEGDINPTGEVRMGGGIPANVAQRLLAVQPDLWNWVPVDYKPGFRIQHVSDENGLYDMPLCPPSSSGLWPQTSFFAPGANISPSGYAVAAIDSQSGSISRGVSTVIQHIQNNTQPGEPIVLCGLSQGAWCCDNLLDEFRFGCLNSRLDDLISVMAFGSPLRPYGHTIDLPGATNPSGQGACSFPRTMTYGVEPGLLRSPPPWAWDLCNVHDGASDSYGSPANVVQAINAIARFAQYGTIKSGIALYLQFYSVVGGLITNESAIWEELRLFLPFVAGGKASAGDPTYNNPHAQYANTAYTSLAGNTTMTGVDLAVERLQSLAAEWAGLPPGSGTPGGSLGGGSTTSTTATWVQSA